MGGGDDLLVVTVTLAWELVRLNPRHHFRELRKGRQDACVELSVLASGFLRPSPPRDVHRAFRRTSLDAVLRLTVRGPGHDKVCTHNIYQVIRLCSVLLV